MVLTLWKDKKLPIIDGLLYNSTLYEIDDEKLECKVLNKKPFLLAKKDYLKKYFSYIHTHKSIEYKGMKIYAGEGSWGGDGFILVLTKEGQLYWLWMDMINPIEDIECKNDVIYAVNNCEAEFIIPLHTPEKLIIKKKY